MTNKTFDLKRFWNLFQSDVQFNYKVYVYTLLTAAIAIYLYFVWDMTANTGLEYNHYRYKLPMYFVSYGYLAFVGMAFPAFSDKKEISQYLLLPASIFEKYLVQFLIRFVLVLPFLFLFYWLGAHLGRLTALQLDSAQQVGLKIAPLELSNLYPFKTAYNVAVYSSALLTLAAYFFSVRLYFKRLALPKSLIVLTLLAGVFWVLMIVMTHLFYPHHGLFDVYMEDFLIGKDFFISNVFALSLICFSWLFFLPFGYYKLKEKQA